MGPRQDERAEDLPAAGSDGPRHVHQVGRGGAQDARHRWRLRPEEAQAGRHQKGACGAQDGPAGGAGHELHDDGHVYRAAVRAGREPRQGGARKEDAEDRGQGLQLLQQEGRRGIEPGGRDRRRRPRQGARGLRWRRRRD
eukprot:3987478-Prymnesium_polylepis.1